MTSLANNSIFDQPLVGRKENVIKIYYNKLRRKKMVNFIKCIIKY